MKRFIQLALIMSAIVMMTTSCATIISGKTAKVKVDSKQPIVGKVVLTYYGHTEEVYLPHTIKVKRRATPTIITAFADGYAPVDVTIRNKFNGTVWWNILFGGIVGVGVDALTGAKYKPEKKNIMLDFQKTSGPSLVTPIANSFETGLFSHVQNKEPEPKKTVEGSAIENLNIRCRFDSNPRGAQILWRIVSSVPSEVKNTDELWLSNSPVDTNHTFKIMGLTQQNAQDVQIEIKVKCKGYDDQVQRFNVKQAIEQQEISAYFELSKH